MKRNIETSGYYLLPLVFLIIGISQLSTLDTRMIGIAFIGFSIFAGAVAFWTRKVRENATEARQREAQTNEDET
jgi:hypothetical protein